MELIRALAVLAEPPTAETARLADVLDLGRAPDPSEFSDLFVFQLYPYASVYTGAEGALGGEARDRVAGFWRAVGIDPPAEPDHLAALLGLYAELDDRERVADTASTRAALEHARTALLWEHLLSWLAPFLRKLDQVGPPPYVAWGRLLRFALWSEAEATPPPPRLPLHLRAAPALPAADAEADAWLEALLAPVRSGLVLTRADLARAAHDLGLGLRAGERRFALRALLAQDADATLDWLVAEARAAGHDHAAEAETLGAIAEFWSDRARRTADTLTTWRTKEATHAG